MKRPRILTRLCAITLLCSGGYLAAQGSSQVKEMSSRPAFIDLLKRMNGVYHWNAATKSYVFDQKAELERLLTGRDDRNDLIELADCIDDLQPSNSTLNGKQVPVGIICYQALTQLIYFEPTTQTGDVAKHWPGYIKPDASQRQLKLAKRAWLKVIEAGKYSKL